MKAVVEYENGETETLVDLQGFGREIVENILKGYEVQKIWLLNDDEDESEHEFIDPYWTLGVWWVTRADCETAKVYLGGYEEDDFWSAFERQYPAAYCIIPDDAPESAELCDHKGWDAVFWPGEGKALARWLAEPEYWLDVQTPVDPEDLFSGGTATLGPFATVGDAKDEAESCPGKWRIYTRRIPSLEAHPEECKEWGAYLVRDICSGETKEVL